MSDNHFDNIALGLESMGKKLEPYNDMSEQFVKNIIQSMIEFQKRVTEITRPLAEFKKNIATIIAPLAEYAKILHQRYCNRKILMVLCLSIIQEMNPSMQEE